MKKLFTPLNLFSILMITLFLGINSCKKTDNESSSEKLTDKDFITESKEYFEHNFDAETSQKELSEKNNPNQFQKLVKKPLWDYAKAKDISIGQSVRVPILFDKEIFTRAGKDKGAISLYNLSYLMMYKDKKGKMHTEWVVAIPDDDYVDRKRNSGVKFSGLINVFDWQGNIIKNYRIKKDGTIYHSNSISFSKRNISLDANDKKTDVANDDYDCYYIDYYTCAGTSADPYAYGCHYSDSQYTCDLIPGSGGSGDSGGGNTGEVGGGGTNTGPGDYTPNNPDCPKTTGGATNSINGGLQVEVANPCDKGLFDIVNNIKDPCLKKMVQYAIDNDIKLNLKESINSIFQNNDDFKLNFYETSSLANSTDGTTRIVQDKRYNFDGSRVLRIDIDLNVNTLPNSSKEFISATILHEALHAYFGYNGTILDHDNMAENYLNWFTNSLINLYPNLPLDDARKLGLGGLGNTQYFNNNFSPLEKGIAANVNQDYKLNIKGSPCN